MLLKHRIRRNGVVPSLLNRVYATPLPFRVNRVIRELAVAQSSAPAGGSGTFMPT